VTGVLAVIGCVLVLDAAVAALMLLLWAVKGHVPDFLRFDVFAVVMVVAIAVKIVGGLAAAIQLWRLKPSGRLLAMVVTTTGALVAVLAAAHASKLTDTTTWVAVGLYALMLLLVALPASERALDTIVPIHRTGRIAPPPPAPRRRSGP
jgi:hypothetical protein